MTLWDDQASHKRIGRMAGIASAVAQGNHVWTEAEVDTLMYLRDDEYLSYADIAKELDISERACQAKHERVTIERRLQRDGRSRATDKCPNKNYIDRELRARARDNQSIGGLTFGDPPPGYSALDKRRQSA